jgi:hypothetical protein
MPITALPLPPLRSDPANFSSRADAFMSALPTFATEANQLQSDVNAKQTAAAANQTAAQSAQAAAEAASNATVWVSGTTYAIGNVRYSPSDFKSYRRKTAGAGTTDPSADPTNWQLLTGLGNVDLTATQTVTNKTFGSGCVWDGAVIPIVEGGTGATTAVNAFNALKQNATDTASGVVELATAAEFIAGTDTTRVPSVSSLRTGKPALTLTLNGNASVQLASIPSWVTRITIVAAGVSTTGTGIGLDILMNNLTTGYVAGGSELKDSSINSFSATTGVRVVSTAINNAATDIFSGTLSINRVFGTNVWSVVGTMNEHAANNLLHSACVRDLGAALTSIQFQATGSTFDAGTLYATWE